MTMKRSAMTRHAAPAHTLVHTHSSSVDDRLVEPVEDGAQNPIHRRRHCESAIAYGEYQKGFHNPKTSLALLVLCVGQFSIVTERSLVDRHRCHRAISFAAGCLGSHCLFSCFSVLNS